MGKKRNSGRYDQTNLDVLIDFIKVIRTPYKQSSIAISNVELEATIKGLPNRERKCVETFFGLVPGTINHYQCQKYNELAYQNMANAAFAVLKKLGTLEYLEKYSRTVRKAITRLTSKVDSTGIFLSKVEQAQYLILLAMILDAGPKMSFDADSPSNDVDSKMFDDYAVVVELNRILDECPNTSINLRLLIEVLEMFDLKDVAVMKKTVNLRVAENPQEPIVPLKNIGEIRKFKERIFPYGAWNLVTDLILGSKENLDFSALGEDLEKFRKDWDLQRFNSGNVCVLDTSTGQRTLNIYTIGGFNFTDPYEVMFLCVSRNILL